MNWDWGKDSMVFFLTQQLFLFVLIKLVLRDHSRKIYNGLFLILILGLSFGLYTSLKLWLSIILVILYLLYVYWHRRVLSQSIIITMETHILSLISAQLAIGLSRWINQPDWKLTIFIGLQIIVISLVMFILMHTKLSLTFKTYRLNRYLAALLATIYLAIILVSDWQYQPETWFINLVILFVLAGLLTILYMEYLKTVKTRYQIEKQSQQMQADARYLSEVETHYNELRQFRHDYQNMLISIEDYLTSDDLPGLKTYYETNIKPVSQQLMTDKYHLEDLSRVQVKAIKSILFSKLSYAQAHHIETHFELKTPFSALAVNDLDVIVALGIILDNAIDALMGHPDGKLMSGIFVDQQNVVFMVQNDTYDKLPPIWQLQQRGFSTKGPDRGLGLAHLNQIVERNDQMILETRQLGTLFLQQLTVKRAKNND